MKNIGELYQSADWREEKHVPLIECPDSVKKGEFFNVTVTVGKEVAHPNKTEHHIDRITLFFQPEGEKFPYEIGTCTFNAHGASTNGADTSTVYTHHQGQLAMKTEKPGTLLATSLCNIHGLWQNAKEIGVG